MTQRRTEFRDEFGIVPDFMVPIAAIGFACMMYVFLNYMPQHDPHAPPFPVRRTSACTALLRGGR